VSDPDFTMLIDCEPGEPITTRFTTDDPEIYQRLLAAAEEIGAEIVEGE
jgi:hypothetical protein